MQKRNPLAHVDSYVDATPGLRDLLTDLSEMAVAMAPEMDRRAVPNVLWAMGMLRQNMLGAWNVYLNAMCCMHGALWYTMVSPSGNAVSGRWGKKVFRKAQKYLGAQYVSGNQHSAYTVVCCFPHS